MLELVLVIIFAAIAVATAARRAHDDPPLPDISQTLELERESLEVDLDWLDREVEALLERTVTVLQAPHGESFWLDPTAPIESGDEFQGGLLSLDSLQRIRDSGTRLKVAEWKPDLNLRDLTAHLTGEEPSFHNAKEDIEMSESEGYTPSEVWTWDKESGGEFANINRPIAGPTHEKELPVGEHPFQLYSLATPNGVKVTIMFEELLELGREDAEYDAWLIDISEGDQFGSGFVEVNPNSKIPALLDHRRDPPQRVFESGSILLHLAESFGEFLPEAPRSRTEAFNWLFWQVGSAPYLGGGFGHFYAYAPEPMEYPIDRFAMETKRQLDVLDRHLAEHEYMAGEEYSIADMANWPWYGALALGRLYEAADFLSVHEYENVIRWAEQLDERPAVQRGRMVNRAWGDPSEQLPERHEASDFDERTMDKLQDDAD